MSYAVRLAIVLSFNSCGDCSDGLPDDHYHGDAGDGTGDVEAAFEGCPDSTPSFALGMQAVGEQGNLNATLLAASNIPPLRYLNDWDLKLTAADGSPLSEAQIVMARPFMPVHGHDGNVQPKVSALGTPGEFRITGFNLIMRGPWEIQLAASSPDTGDDYLVFHICVEE